MYKHCSKGLKGKCRSTKNGAWECFAARTISKGNRVSERVCTSTAVKVLKGSVGAPRMVLGNALQLGLFPREIGCLRECVQALQ